MCRLSRDAYLIFLGTLFGNVAINKTLYISEMFPITFDVGPLSYIPIESIKYTCRDMKLKIETSAIEAFTILQGILELHDLTISIEATLSPIGVQQFTFTGNWNLGGINGRIGIEERLETSQLVLSGGPECEISLNVEDFIESLSGKRLSLPISSVRFRDLKMVAIVDTFTSGTATYSISGKYGQNNTAYVFFQRNIRLDTKENKYSAGFAAEMTEITLADLIMDLTGTDISDVPFLGTVLLPEIAVTLSMEDISVSSLLERLDSGSLLRLSGSNIRNGVAAFFNLGEMEDVPIKMTHSDSSFSFDVLKGRSFSLSSLVPRFGFSLDSLSLPPRINNILDLDIKDFSLNSLSREFHVNVPLPDNLTYFDGQLTVKNAVVGVHAILNASSSISVEVEGSVVFGDGEIDVLIRQDITSDNYVVFSRVSPRSIPEVFELFGPGIVPKNVLDTLSDMEFFEFSANLATRQLAFRSGSKDETAISFEHLLQSTGGEKINLPFHLASFRNVEAFGQMDTQPGGGANISFSVTYGENNTAHLLLQRKVNSAGQATYAAAFALEITEITLADLIMDLTGTDISDVPFLGTVVLPEMAVTLSTEDISVSSLLERLDSGSLLRLSGSNIRNRVAAFFNMGEKEDVPVKMTHSDSSFSFDVLKGQSFSLSSLVSQFGFSLGSLSLPPRINNILDLDIKDFSLNSLSREFHVNVLLPNNLTYFDGQLTVKNAVVRVHAILNASSSISVEVKGRVVFGDGEIDVLIRQDITSDNYVIFSRVSPRSIPGVFELFGVGIVPKNVLDTLSGLEFFEFNANLATRHLAFRSGSKDETAISFENLLQSTSGERINIPFYLASFRNVEAFGQMDTQPGGGANISFSVTYGENNTAHLLLQRKVNSAGQATYAAAFALEITEINLADLIMDLIGADISDLPFIGSVVLPEIAVTLSTEDISVSSLLERLDSGSLLRLSGSNIRNRVAAFFNMGEKEDVPVQMTHSDSSFSFDVLKGQSFSLSSLVPQFGFNLSSLSLPPRINNILDLNIKDFSINSLSREFQVNIALPDNLTYFDGQLTVKNAVVRVHAILNASSSISVEVEGSVVFGDGEINVLIRQDITSDNYVVFSRVSPRSIPEVFELFGPGIVPKNVLDTLSGLEYFEFSANLATRQLAFRSGSKDQTAISFEHLLQSTGGERINLPFHLASFRNVEAFGQMDTQPGGGANISFRVTYGKTIQHTFFYRGR